MNDIKIIGKELTEVLVQSNLAKSKNEARKSILNGGIKIADFRVMDPFARIAEMEHDGKQVLVLVENFQDKVQVNILQNLK